MPIQRTGSLVMDAWRALGGGQRALTGITGASRRTVQRWYANQSQPSLDAYRKLAAAVLPVDRSVAIDLATAGGTTLAELGLEAAHAPALTATATAAATAAASESAPLDVGLLVDSVVCTAAEAIGIMPHAVRPALVAAFERAAKLRLTPDTVAAALRATTPKPPPA